MGIDLEAVEPKTYIHDEPKFSISYPGNWVVQDPTPLMDFNFRAVCETGFPNLTIHVDDVLENGLKESLKRACHFFSTSLGMDAVLISEIQTSLNDGSSAIEGEIELHSPNMFHQLVILVLLAQKGTELSVSVSARSCSNTKI